MGYQLQVRDRTTQDLRSYANYILSAGSADAAVRFLEAAEQTFNQLAETPNIGKVVAIADKAFGDVRQWHIRNFKNHLIFYRLDQETVDILRVLHGARDLGDIIPLLDKLS